MKIVTQISDIELVYVHSERKKAITFTSILYPMFQKSNPVKNSTALMTLKGNVCTITDFMVLSFILREVNRGIKEIYF